MAKLQSEYSFGIQVPKGMAVEFLRDAERKIDAGLPLYLKVIPLHFELISTSTLAEAFEGVKDQGNIAIFDAGKYGKYMGDLCDHGIKMIGGFVNFGEEVACQFEVKQKEYFFDQCSRRGCDIFLDIGANHGAYNVYAHLGKFMLLSRLSELTNFCRSICKF
jgi:hypothetical protein